YKDAAELSESISYDIALNDSVILLNPFFEFPKDNKWRNQEVDILLLVPIGKSVFLDNSVKPYLDDVKNVSNTWDWNMTGLKWTMLSPGLTCINCFEGWQGKSLTPQPD